jgi:hypothetical protein
MAMPLIAVLANLSCYCSSQGDDNYEENWKKNRKNNKRDVYGIHSSGDIYEGDWKDNKEEGRGKYIHSSGDIYGGDWNDDVEDYGKRVYSSGDIYEGDWNDYEGDWKDNKKDLKIKTKSKIFSQLLSYAPHGITNLGNTCYFNAALQALLVCKPIMTLLNEKDSILDKHPGKKIAEEIEKEMTLEKDYYEFLSNKYSEKEEHLKKAKQYTRYSCVKYLLDFLSMVSKGNVETVYDIADFHKDLAVALHNLFLHENNKTQGTSGNDPIFDNLQKTALSAGKKQFLYSLPLIYEGLHGFISEEDEKKIQELRAFCLNSLLLLSGHSSDNIQSIINLVLEDSGASKIQGLCQALLLADDIGDNFVRGYLLENCKALIRILMDTLTLNRTDDNKDTIDQYQDALQKGLGFISSNVGSYIAKQQDVTEILIILLDVLTEFANELPKDIKDRINSFIGTEVEVYSCFECDSEDERRHPFTLLDLAIPLNDATLSGCFNAHLEQRFSKDKKWDDHCSHGPGAMLRCEINPGSTMVIQLNRFQHGGTGFSIAEKINDVVSYDEYISYGPRTYILKAVIDHVGSTLNNGHYTTKILNSDGVWQTVNDDCVGPSGEFQVSEDAYVLIYEQLSPEELSILEEEGKDLSIIKDMELRED